MKSVGKIFREGLFENLKGSIEQSQNTFVVNYTKMSANQDCNLRRDLQKTGAKVIASKNSIAKLVLKELGQDQLSETISNQTAVVVSNSDSVEVSKLLVNFAKEVEDLHVKGGILEGSMINEADVQRLSDLPSREALFGQLLGTIQAPVTRLLGAFNAKSRDLLSILKQYGEKKGGS